MAEATLTFSPIGRRGMRVQLRTSLGWTLSAAGEIEQTSPDFAGAESLTSNPVLVMNVWAYACAEKERRISRDEALREELAKRARSHAKLATNLADLVERIGTEIRSGWCSACFEKSTHALVERSRAVPTYICQGCGAATLTCVAPRCDNMSTRGFGNVRVPRFCAEHRHDLPSFERSKEYIADLTDLDPFFEYDERNYAKTTKIAATTLVAAGAMTGVGLMAAPMIGGFVGATVGGYSGAAATSYGLALLGGGSVAAGGLGMAGGTAVVAAAGASLGGGLGARLSASYVSQDKSFRFERLADGPGIPVFVCSGFLTEEIDGWADWRRIVTERYPDSPVYRVRWGSSELKDLAAMAGVGAGKVAALKGVKHFAMKAGKKAATKAGPVGVAFAAFDLAQNPWWKARQRANKTGVIVAELLARTELDEVVLIGHSLGARAMVCAAQSLGTKSAAPTVREAHFLGAAIGAKSDWSTLDQAVSGTAYNYHSTHDKVLKYFYTAAQGGSRAAGTSGFETKLRGIANIDVSSTVADHSYYCRKLTLR